MRLWVSVVSVLFAALLLAGCGATKKKAAVEYAPATAEETAVLNYCKENIPNMVVTVIKPMEKPAGVSDMKVTQYQVTLSKKDDDRQTIAYSVIYDEKQKKVSGPPPPPLPPQ